jgi:hypothetical protein
MLTFRTTPPPVPAFPSRTAVVPPGPVVELAFLAVLPRVAAVARFAFRHVRCPETRADRVAEAVGLAWKKFVLLSARGKDPAAFPTTLAMRCCQAVRAGRRLVRAERTKDVLSPVAQARHAFRVERLPTRVKALGRPRLPPDLADALADDPRGRVPDRAAFRIDFPAWRAGLGRKHRRVMDALAVGGRTDEVAAAVKVSPGRVSQMRRELAASWNAFHAGER